MQPAETARLDNRTLRAGRDPRGILLVLATVVALIAVGATLALRGSGPSVAPTTGSIVDGFPLGAPAGSDAQIAAKATTALDQAQPGHAAIVSSRAYREDLQLVYGAGSARSGTMTIFVFALADGSYHAAGVYCGVTDCEPWPVYAPPN